VLKEIVDFQPANDNLDRANPGKVVSDEEITAAASDNWDTLFACCCKNIQKFFTKPILGLYEPNSRRISDLVEGVINTTVQKSAFGGGESTRMSLGFLLGGISHTRRILPVLQLDAILEYVRFLEVKHDELDGTEAQKLWLIGDNTEMPTTHEQVREVFTKNIALTIARQMVVVTEEVRESGRNIFDQGLSWPRSLMFLAPSGWAHLTGLRHLSEKAPFGRMELTSQTQTLLNAGSWTAHELYADMLESCLQYMDDTVKSMTKTEEGWALQPSNAQFKNASLDDLAFYVKAVTSARARQRKRKSAAGRRRAASRSSSGSSKKKARRSSHRAIPDQSSMLTRDRRAAPAAPLSLFPPAASGSAEESTSTGSRALNLKDSAIWTDADRDAASRAMTEANRGRATEYGNEDGVLGLSDEMQQVIFQGESENTRYHHASRAPAPGARKYFSAAVGTVARDLNMAVSQATIDALLQGKISRINFNLFEINSAHLGLEVAQSRQKQQLPVNGIVSLEKQFIWFEQIYACIVGKTEAHTVVEFWKREFLEFRFKRNVDWNTAYTFWRNMLVDYEIRCKEWNPSLHARPTMWDWEDRTQRLYERILKRGDLDVYLGHVEAWSLQPVIYREISLTEAITEDESAIVSMRSVLGSISLHAPIKPKKTKTTKKKKKKTSKKKAVVSFESESEEEESESEEEVEEVSFGRLCRNQATGEVVKKCRKCPFFAKHGVCGFYHADAPKGTTGKRSTLNNASRKKMEKFRSHFY
jgi:hypothetical protein